MISSFVYKISSFLRIHESFFCREGWSTVIWVVKCKVRRVRITIAKCFIWRTRIWIYKS